jgi:putative colanic acid biosynthesis glycosyltransferase
MIKIVMVSTEKTRGGAARMATLLARSLLSRDEGIELKFFHCEDDIVEPPFYGIKKFASRQINAGLARVGGSTCVLDFGVAEQIIAAATDADILHIHNVHGYYLNWEKLFRAWQDRPVVWTWHDQWGATGRCGFAIDCDVWKTGCASCDHMDYYPAAMIDRASEEFTRKSAAYDAMNHLRLVSPSKWLGDIAIERGFSAEQVSVVPNPVDLNAYLLRDKQECRKALGIAADEFVALFIAADCNDVRKGYVDFVDVVDGLDIYPLAVGGLPTEQPAHVHHAGEVREQQQLAMYYGAADVMVFTSRADNYPNTVIESLVCGTPILAYDVGGVSSQLDYQYCRLVPFGDKETMRDVLKNMNAAGGKTVNMQDELHAYARSMWADDVIAGKYLGVYRQCLEAANFSPI